MCVREQGDEDGPEGGLGATPLLSDRPGHDISLTNEFVPSFVSDSTPWSGSENSGIHLMWKHSIK